MRRLAVIVAACLVPSLAAAEPWIIEPTPEAQDAVQLGDAEVQRAQGLAKQKAYTEAVQVLEAVAQARPASAHDCNLALAYLRNDQLTRAQLMADVARARGGALPDWCTGTLAKELARALKDEEYVPLTVSVTPADAVIELEGLTVRGVHLFWLPVATYQVVARAEGYDAAKAAVVVAAPSAELAITLKPTPVEPVVPVEPPPDDEIGPTERDPFVLMEEPAPLLPPPSPKPTWPGWVGVAGGGAVLAIGGLFHLSALSTKDEADHTINDTPMFDNLSSQFARERAIAITGYVIGTAAVGFGIWWLSRTLGERE